MADDGIAVEVEAEDENGSYNNDAALRAQAMINSPKGKTAVNFDDDDNAGGNGGMSLSLGAVDDEYEDPEKVTPNTRRDQMDINSPRHKHGNKWDATGVDDSNNNPALAGLVTQVARDDPSKQSGAESLVTQVSRNDDTELNIQKHQQQPSGMCAMFSCLFCCCSQAPPPEAVPLQSTNKAEQRYPPSSGSAGAKQSGQAPPNKEDNTQLLTTEGGGNRADRADAREHSQSSTIYPDASNALLPPLKPELVGKKCLVLDLDETLVHSSFKPIPKPDFIIPVEIDKVVHHVYVLKRPFVDEFLLRASKCYEIVIFTASLSKYADPLLDKLDIHNVIDARLFRESCVIHGTAYVKDLRKLGRKLKDSIIVDNSPPSYLFQPTNAVPITSWFDDPTDTQLLDFCPVIETTMNDIDDVRKLLDANNKSFRWLCNQAHQPLTKYTVRNDLVNRQQ